MAAVETTTIRVRRSTHRRLAEEAKLAGTSVIDVLDVAIDLLEEQRMLEGAIRSWEKHGAAMRAEMKWWNDIPGPPLPDDDWPELLSEES